MTTNKLQLLHSLTEILMRIQEDYGGFTLDLNDPHEETDHALWMELTIDFEGVPGAIETIVRDDGRGNFEIEVYEDHWEDFQSYDLGSFWSFVAFSLARIASDQAERAKRCEDRAQRKTDAAIQ